MRPGDPKRHFRFSKEPDARCLLFSGDLEVGLSWYSMEAASAAAEQATMSTHCRRCTTTGLW